MWITHSLRSPTKRIKKKPIKKTMLYIIIRNVSVFSETNRLYSKQKKAIPLIIIPLRVYRSIFILNVPIHNNRCHCDFKLFWASPISKYRMQISPELCYFNVLKRRWINKTKYQILHFCQNSILIIFHLESNWIFAMFCYYLHGKRDWFFQS